MNLNLVIFSAACLTYLATPAAGTRFFTAGASVEGAGLGAGAVLSSSGGSEPVVIQAEPGTICLEGVPAHQVVVQHPVVEYKPVHPITLVPVSASYSFTDKISKLLGGISSAVSIKARAVSDFLRSLRAPPRVVLFSVNKPTCSTTTTTEKPTTTASHNPPQVTYEIVAAPPQEYYRLRHSAPVVVLEDGVKNTVTTKNRFLRKKRS